MMAAPQPAYGYTYKSTTSLTLPQTPLIEGSEVELQASVYFIRPLTVGSGVEPQTGFVVNDTFSFYAGNTLLCTSAQGSSTCYVSINLSPGFYSFTASFSGYESGGNEYEGSTSPPQWAAVMPTTGTNYANLQLTSSPGGAWAKNDDIGSTGPGQATGTAGRPPITSVPRPPPILLAFLFPPAYP